MHSLQSIDNVVSHMLTSHRGHAALGSQLPKQPVWHLFTNVLCQSLQGGSRPVFGKRVSGDVVEKGKDYIRKVHKRLSTSRSDGPESVALHGLQARLLH